MDLAHKGRGTIWQVEGDFKQALRELGDRNDIIKQLYSHLGSEAGRVERMIRRRRTCRRPWPGLSLPRPARMSWVRTGLWSSVTECRARSLRPGPRE